MERQARLLHDYTHVFDYLGLRVRHVQATAELDAALRDDRPMALIWDLSAGLDSGEVLHAISQADRHLPLLIIADVVRAPDVIDSMVRFLRIPDVMKLPCDPALRDVVEFLFRAGRKSGRFRVLSV